MAIDARNAEQHPQIQFVTLGMFILDDIQAPAPSKILHKAIAGGAGTYSALGARLFASRRAFTSNHPTADSQVPQEAQYTTNSIAWILDAGHDFPHRLREEIETWHTAALIREDPTRATTSGWNGYEGSSEKRSFKYTTPKRRLDADDLTLPLLASRSFHVISSASRCVQLVTRILERRLEELYHGDAEEARVNRPVFIWEPVPDLCTPGELGSALEASRVVDVVSPNHGELCAFFGRCGEVLDGASGGWTVDRGVVEECARRWVRDVAEVDSKSVIVVRAGKEGCFSCSRSEEIEWTAAYHQDSARLVDPTGGGNAFLGGFAMGYLSQGTLKAARAWGSVAASFAIEQVGLPSLSWDARGRELWNGESVVERLREFESREQQAREKCSTLV